MTYSEEFPMKLSVGNKLFSYSDPKVQEEFYISWMHYFVY